MHLPTLRRTAAEIAAAAVFELFPQVKLLGGSDTSIGFYYDFYFPHLIHPETLSMIEERMRQIVRERRPIRTLEMVAFSAGELLKSQGHFQRIEELPEEGLAELIEMGSFHDLSAGPHLKNTAEVAAFKLQMIEPLEGRYIRITGTAHRDKKALKDFLKKLSGYDQKDPLKIGERLGLWTQAAGQWVWLERGLRTKERLLHFLKEAFPQSQEIKGPREAVRPAFYLDLARTVKGLPLRWQELSLGEEPLLEGLEETQFQIISLFGSAFFEDEMISYLQTIDKTLNILSFRYDLGLVGRKRTEKGLQKFFQCLEKLGRQFTVECQEESVPHLNVCSIDFLERSWTVAQIKSILTKEAHWEGLILTFSVERILLLLLEGYGGMVPFWLASE